jgi:cyclohexa-1,5-dienecarbonyl-CoA hydratase
MDTAETASYKHILFDRSTAVAHMTLNDAPYNLLTIPLMREMAEAIESLNGVGEIRCILLDSAAQGVFSYGISREDSRPENVFQTLDAFTRVFNALNEISKPLLVVMNGQAIGAGSELAALGDLILATPATRFAQPEVQVGIFPPFASVMLPAIIGPKKAYEMILTGQPLTAEEACELGLINRVVNEEHMESTVQSILSRIVEFSGPVLEMSKTAIQRSMGMPLREALKQAHDLYLNQLMDLKDAQEGVQALLENRRPVWKNK